MTWTLEIDTHTHTHLMKVLRKPATLKRERDDLDSEIDALSLYEDRRRRDVLL